MSIDEGETVGNYELGHNMGSGAFGQTFAAINVNTHEQVVLKFLPSNSPDEAAEEARALGKLDRHHAVVEVKDAIIEAMPPYLVLELVPGIDLAEYLDSYDAPRPALWWQTLKPLLSGVQHLHSAGVVHGDLKPANIILRDSNPTTPVIIDFGAAKDSSKILTSIIGTDMYMDPMIREYKFGQADPSWDIYSLSVLSFEAMFPVEFSEFCDSVDRKRFTFSQARDAMRHHLNGFGHPFFEAMADALTDDPSKKPKSIVEWLASMVRPDDEYDDTRVSDSLPTSQPEHTVARVCRDIEDRFKLPYGSVKLADRDGSLEDAERPTSSLLRTWEGPYFEMADEDTVAAAREYIAGFLVGEFLRSHKNSVCIVEQDEETPYHGGVKVKRVRREHGNA